MSNIKELVLELNDKLTGLDEGQISEIKDLIKSDRNFLTLSDKDKNLLIDQVVKQSISSTGSSVAHNKGEVLTWLRKSLEELTLENNNFLVLPAKLFHKTEESEAQKSEVKSMLLDGYTVEQDNRVYFSSKIDKVTSLGDHAKSDMSRFGIVIGGENIQLDEDWFSETETEKKIEDIFLDKLFEKAKDDGDAKNILQKWKEDNNKKEIIKEFLLNFQQKSFYIGNDIFQVSLGLSLLSGVNQNANNFEMSFNNDENLVLNSKVEVHSLKNSGTMNEEVAFDNPCVIESEYVFRKDKGEYKNYLQAIKVSDPVICKYVNDAIVKGADQSKVDTLVEVLLAPTKIKTYIEKQLRDKSLTPVQKENIKEKIITDDFEGITDEEDVDDYIQKNEKSLKNAIGREVGNQTLTPFKTYVLDAIKMYLDSHYTIINYEDVNLVKKIKEDILLGNYSNNNDGINRLYYNLFELSQKVDPSNKNNSFAMCLNKKIPTGYPGSQKKVYSNYEKAIIKGLENFIKAKNSVFSKDEIKQASKILMQIKLNQITELELKKEIGLFVTNSDPFSTDTRINCINRALQNDKLYKDRIVLNKDRKIAGEGIDHYSKNIILELQNYCTKHVGLAKRDSRKDAKKLCQNLSSNNLEETLKKWAANDKEKKDVVNKINNYGIKNSDKKTNSITLSINGKKETSSEYTAVAKISHFNNKGLLIIGGDNTITFNKTNKEGIITLLNNVINKAKQEGHNKNIELDLDKEADPEFTKIFIKIVKEKQSELDENGVKFTESLLGKVIGSPPSTTAAAIGSPPATGGHPVEGVEPEQEPEKRSNKP
tara:strand:- start:212 stop:2674 length:2463 start_codon:yes stop_codon:yes gene_type:complete